MGHLAYMPTRDEIAATLKARRLELGLTQEEMAKAARVTVNGYRAWEYGKAGINSKRIPGLAKALKLPPERLLVDNDSLEEYVELDELVPSLRRFLDAYNDQIDDEEREIARSQRFKGWDPGDDYWPDWLLRLRRARKNAQARPDATADHPDLEAQGYLKLKK
jgi:transcriptional regulator with XRE-family HTH domain